MRRHSPRDSPNSTRDLGPIDATIRESLLAFARTTTQCLETVRTQRGDRRAGGETAATDFADVEAIGDASIFGGTDAGTAALVAGARATVSRAAVSAITIGSDAKLSVVAATSRAVVESVSRAAEAAGSGFVCACGVSWADPFRSNQTTPINPTRATPAPRQMRGSIGARSGFVPHHLHEPTLSG